MDCKFIAQLSRLRKLSAESVENTSAFDPFKEYLHVERQVELELRELLRKINGNQEKCLVLLCGSAGDGKSHLISYLILTPYRNQSKLLKRQLPTAADENRIMTVHSSQSREWDTVFLSVVDTTAAFLTDSTNPLNHGLETIVTAVSRAKKKLVIVCDVNYWSNQDGQLLQGLINAADTVFSRFLSVYEEVEY